MAKEVKEAEEKIKGPFKFDYAWWDNNRPALLPSTGLGKALKAYQDAKKKFESSPGILNNYVAAVDALKAADKARAAAAKKCGSAFKKTKAALENSDASFASEETLLRGVVAPLMIKDARYWVERLKQNLGLLETDQVYITKLIDGVKKNDPESRKKAMKLLETEGDNAVRTIRPSQGSMADTMLKMRSRLGKLFPVEYAELDKIKETADDIGDAFRTVNELHGELHDAFYNPK